MTEPQNEAAERLRTYDLLQSAYMAALLDAALATERRNTILFMEREGVVTYADDAHRSRILDETEVAP